MSRPCPCWTALCLIALTLVAGGCSSSSPPISVSLSPSSPQAIDQGQTAGIMATVTNDKSFNGVSWSLTGPGSLSNLAGPSVTYIPPTTNLATGQPATVTATSLADPTKSASAQITVNPYLQLPYQAIANGSVGAPYSQTIVFSGGTAPFQWSVYGGPLSTGCIVGGAVPDGLNLDPNTGIISGTPTSAGTWSFEATVTDATSASVIDGFLSIQINPTAPAGNPVPFLNQPLVPTAVSPGNPGFQLKVSGTGFVPGATVYFGRLPLPTTFVDGEHLTALVPATSVASAGTSAVTVLNSGTTAVPSNVVYFQVAAPQATVNFTAAANSPLQIYEPSALAAGDFNEDGKPDLVIAGATKVFVFLGNGDGTFAPAAGSPIQVPSPPCDDFPTPYLGAIAVGDFNNSGHLGLAAVEFENEAAVILLGKGDGTFVFSSAEFANTSGGYVWSAEAADFNADGGLDLATTGGVDLGYGKGNFNAAGSLYGSGVPQGLAVGDFNADGKLDAVVASGGVPPDEESGLGVALGNGDGAFKQASGSPILFGGSLFAIVTGDFNGDGELDLAVTDTGDNVVRILLGNGDGTFGPPTAIPVGSYPTAIIAADFNNDGKLDLATANGGGGTTMRVDLTPRWKTCRLANSPARAGLAPPLLVLQDPVFSLLSWT
ncbi:MAG: FG-GAP-like repeat-containing protein [Candidatus Acidiferrales bacterium]